MTRQSFSASGQNASKDYLVSVAGATDNVSVGSTTAAAAVVSMLAPGVGKGQNTVSQAFWSYTTSPTGGRLTVQDTNGTLFDQDITHTNGQNLGVFSFNPPLQPSAQNSALTLTLAGVANATGKLSIQGWLEI